MTGDPKRWLSDGEAGAIERELLSSVRDAAPPAGAKDDAWRAIAATMAAGAVVTSATSAASAAATTAAVTKSGGAAIAGSLATKAVWTIAAGSIAFGGYYAVRSASPHREPVRAPAAQVAAAPAPVEQVDDAPLEAAPIVEQPEAMQREARRAAPRAKRRDPLAEESALLTRARAAVRAGDTAAAERMLQRMTVEFPGGVLEQERQVLEIELLAARGKLVDARARARRFSEAYPSSPHTARLRSLLDTP